MTLHKSFSLTLPPLTLQDLQTPPEPPKSSQEAPRVLPRCCFKTKVMGYQCTLDLPHLQSYRKYLPSELAPKIAPVCLLKSRTLDPLCKWSADGCPIPIPVLQTWHMLEGTELQFTPGPSSLLMALNHVHFPGGWVVKNPPANPGDTENMDSIPGYGRSPREGNGNQPQYFCLENPMDREA